MEINHWTRQLHSLYDAAIEKYKGGQRGPDTFFDAEETAFLSSIGLKPIGLYDYVEDFVRHGEPDWDTYLLIAAARRDYFTHEMGAKWSINPFHASDLPGKDEDYEGIAWLPRIIPKAKGFLEGALPEETMYGCGGDRKFFKENRIHPADFLRVVWATHADQASLADYCRYRRK